KPAVAAAAVAAAEPSPSSVRESARSSPERDDAGRDSPPEPTPPNHVPAYVSWAVGGAALAVGATFGVIAMNDKSDLDARCSGKVCPVESQSKLDQARSAGTIATVAFGVGAAGVALGTVLYFTAGQGGTDGAVRASGPSRSIARHRQGPRAWLGVGQVTFATDF
ncbi:MAG TPA: hypothetical protein VF395_19590, partial [Polyangiaceae bacterium]